MADKETAGASAPAIEVNGNQVAIDREMASTWDAFKYLRVLNDQDAEGVYKMDAAMGYAALVSGLDEDGLVEIAGGGHAQIAEVMDVVAQIIAAASPKN